jgi:hypothetical protein
VNLWVQQTREDAEALELTEGQIVYARPHRRVGVAAAANGDATLAKVPVVADGAAPRETPA